jgi:hypothetical protein
MTKRKKQERKKSVAMLPQKLTMRQCRKVRTGLEKKIARLSIKEQDELSDYLKGYNRLALEKTGKLLEAPTILWLTTRWFAKEEKTEREKKV